MFGSAGMQVASLYAKLGADTKDFERAMKNADGVIGKTGATLGTLAKVGIGAAVAGLGALAGGLTASLKSAADFDKVMSGAKAVLGATAEEMTALNAKALQLGKDTAFSAKEAALAIEMLAKNGLTAQQISDGAADATVALAAATGANLSTAADIATDAMLQFGLGTDELSRAINGISGVVVSSKFDINDYALALGQAGGIAGSVGVSFEDFNAAVVATASNFPSGSDAGTSLKTFFTRLVPESDKAADMMRKLGLFTGLSRSEFDAAAEKIAKYQDQLNRLDPTSKNFSKRYTEITDKISILQSTLQNGQSAFFDTEGNIRSMAQIAGALNNAFADLSDYDRLEFSKIIFGQDSARAAFGLSKWTQQSFEDMQKKMLDVDASAQALTRLDNLAGDLEQLSGSFETLKIKIGQAFTPLARKVVQALTGNLNKLLDLDFTKFADKVDGVFKLISSPKVGAMVQKLTASFVKFGQMTRNVFLSLVKRLKVFTSPIMKAFKAVSYALTGMFKRLTIKGTRNFFTQLGAELKWFGLVLTNWIAPHVPKVLSALSDMLSRMSRWIVNTALPTLMTTIATWGGPFLRWAADLWAVVLPGLLSLWTNLASWVTDDNKRQTLIDTLTGWASAFAEWAGELWTSHIQPGLFAAWEWLSSWVTDSAKRQTLIDALFEWGEAFATWAKTLWERHLRPGLTAAWEWLSSWVTDTEKRKTLVNKLVDWASAFGSWAMNLWKNYIVPGVGNAWSELSSWVTDSEKRTKLLGWLNDTWTGFTEWAAGMWEKAKPELEKLLTNVNDWIATNQPNLKSWIDTIGSFFSGMSNQFESELPSIQKRWIEFVDKINSELERVANAFGSTFGPAGAASAFGKFFTNVLITIGDVFLTLVESMLVKLRVLAESFASFGTIGSAIMSGDMAAVWAGIQELGSAIAGFGDVWKVWADLIGRVGDRFSGNADSRAGVQEFGGRNMEAPPIIGVSNTAPLMGDIYISIDGNVATDRNALREMAEEISRQIWRNAELAGMRLA